MFENARISPLGDRAILVRFANELSLDANQKARLLEQRVKSRLSNLIEEHSANLVSCVFHYDPQKVAYDTLRQEITLLMAAPKDEAHIEPKVHKVGIEYDLSINGGLAEVCDAVGCSIEAFINYHTNLPLTALALGFSPGFLYLGLHKAPYIVPRRNEVQEGIKAGAVLFAAGQTAISSRPIRTGWHVIGYTKLRNFNPQENDPIIIHPGDKVSFHQEGAQ